VVTVGWLPEGWNGITEEVFMSIPCVVGERGISHIVSMKLNESELAKVKQSASTLRDIINGIQL
jgi:L-lactate dehydrogenase